MSGVWGVAVVFRVLGFRMQGSRGLNFTELEVLAMGVRGVGMLEPLVLGFGDSWLTFGFWDLGV